MLDFEDVDVESPFRVEPTGLLESGEDIFRVAVAGEEDAAAVSLDEQHQRREVRCRDLGSIPEIAGAKRDCSAESVEVVRREATDVAFHSFAEALELLLVAPKPRVPLVA